MYTAGPGPHRLVIDGVDQWAHSPNCRALLESGALLDECEVDGEVRSPYGRTGIRGRGSLAHWGPNRGVFHIITRWKVDDNASRMERYGLPLLEVLMIVHRDGKCVLPGGFERDEYVDPMLNFVLGSIGGASSDKQLEELSLAISKAVPCRFLTDIVAADERDTDNAWVEPSCKAPPAPSCQQPSPGRSSANASLPSVLTRHADSRCSPPLPVRGGWVGTVLANCYRQMSTWHGTAPIRARTGSRRSPTTRTSTSCSTGNLRTTTCTAAPWRRKCSASWPKKRPRSGTGPVHPLTHHPLTPFTFWYSPRSPNSPCSARASVL